jgi:adenine-specific DNA-methyltransferase
MNLALFPKSVNEHNSSKTPKASVSIHNRRYLGNKFKLIEFIKRTINDNCHNVDTILDAFSGTGVVGYYLSTNNNKIIFNDILKSSTIPIKAFATTTKYDSLRISKLIESLNEVDTNEDNYFSLNFGGKYFTIDVARKTGAIRDFIEKINISEEEKIILLTSLLYAVDRIANTVGHYDAYSKKLDGGMELVLRPLNIDVNNNINNEVYENDANNLVRKLKGIDLLYLDPPYNSRQYSDTYHLLENLMRWEKPEVFGKAAKMDRTSLKSNYCKKDALNSLQDLIKNIHCRYILMSYNNTGDKRDARSNNRISHDEIISILENKGKVTVFEEKYKEFTTGNTILDVNHKETLYFCEVFKKD